jgi:putative endonuclease
MEKSYCVYILTNYRNGTLYIGVTNDMARRIQEHLSGLCDGFTKKYHTYRLVHYDIFDNPRDAIELEKQLKQWHRSWKINLIEENNPYWRDLSKEFMEMAE